jgi:Sec-independent protein translocase protein TatA
VAALIADVDVALATAADAAEGARSRALDPTLSALDVAAARREMDDWLFGRDRLQEAARRLGQRLIEARKSEEQDARRQDYERVRTARDELAAELREIYPEFERRLSAVLGRIAANDREVLWINRGRLPEGAERLLGAELVARGLGGFAWNGVQTPSIVEELRLPHVWRGRRLLCVARGRPCASGRGWEAAG